MNWNYFNTLGYLSVILWIAMPVLWFLHSRMKPRRWLVHVGLLMGIAALVLAKINSTSHVDRIQPDQTEQLAAIQAEKDAKFKAALESRGDDVANIRFAEDDADDFIDRAGMDESDLKYMEKIEQETDPAWRKNKKNRSSGSGDDAGLEDLIGAEEETAGVASDELDKELEKEPIVMRAEDMSMANRLDSLNLSAIRFMIFIGLLMIIIDYLRRANVYREAYLPLPLPSSWVNSLSPPAVIEERPEKPRRNIPAELAWFTKRGDSFLYLTDDPTQADQIPETMPKIGSKSRQTDVLRVDAGENSLNQEFIFETLWFGRASFVVGSEKMSRELLDNLLARLKKRSTAKARVRQTVHIVWDLAEPIPEPTMLAFRDLASPTGFSLFLSESKFPTTKHTKHTKEMP